MTIFLTTLMEYTTHLDEESYKKIETVKTSKEKTNMSVSMSNFAASLTTLIISCHLRDILES